MNTKSGVSRLEDLVKWTDISHSLYPDLLTPNHKKLGRKVKGMSKQRTDRDERVKRGRTAEKERTCVRIEQ